MKRPPPTPPAPPNEPSGGRGAYRVGELLPRVLKELGVSGELASREALAAWDTLVGEHISAVTRPTAVSRGVLFVRVASSAWLSELQMMKHDILRRLNAGRSEWRIRRIVFSLEERRDPPPGGNEEEPAAPGSA